MRPAASLCLMALLSGCKLELPAVDAGSMEQHTLVGRSDRVTTGKLTAAQVSALAAWLGRHADDWEYRIEDTAPALLVHLEQAGKPVLTVNIHLGFVKARDLFRKLTASERTELLAILEQAKNP